MIKADWKKRFSVLLLCMCFCLVSLAAFQEQELEKEAEQVQEQEQAIEKEPEQAQEQEQAIEKEPEQAQEPELEPQIDLSEALGKSTFSDKFEIGIHYGPWTLKPITNLFEDELVDRVSQEIRDEIRNILFEDLNLALVESDYEDGLSFTTSGFNFGLEMRYFPRGRAGSFSIGFSLERTNIKIRLEGPVNQEYTNGTFVQVDSIAYINMNPLTTNLSFRWDTNPRWMVSPYIVMGFGLAALIGDAGYEYYGKYSWSGPDYEIDDADEKTIKEWEEKSDVNIPNIFYLLQLQFGVRARIIPQVSLNAELGIWNGFVFRLGVFYRF